MKKDNWHHSKADLQEWSNKTGGKNASIAIEGGDEARTAVWNDKELTTYPFSIKHKTIL
jgi:hypothetical protein